MNHVERFHAVMNFQGFDRLPQIEWAYWWDKTIQRWQGEGLPLGFGDPYAICDHFGLDPYYQHWFRACGPKCPKPPSLGAGILADADDYRRLLPTLYADDVEGLRHLEAWAPRQKRGEAVLWITLTGFFWMPRSLLGVERHMYGLYDQPELIHRINQDTTDFHLRMLKKVAGICRPDFMTFAEDMTYNHGPMLSKRLFDEFLAPYYRQVVPLLKEMGTTVLVDSDGLVDDLMGWMTQVGVQGVLPLERQAGCDAARLRQVLPRLRMIGHFDKMVLTGGEPAIRQEFERLLPTMRSGGFIASMDHQTHPGVSLDQYRLYLRLLKEYTEKAGG